MVCPICLSKNVVFYNKLYDDRYGYPGNFEVLICKNCGHKFLKHDFSNDQLSKLYSEFYPRSSFALDDYRPYQEINWFKAWLNGEYSSPFRWVPENIRVLDIGCGFGETLGYYRSHGCDAYGVEADENILRVAKKFNYQVEVGLFDPGKYPVDFFDYITMGQVIEHVTDPLGTFKGIARILKPGGVAIISTPNSNGWGRRFFARKWINWHVPYHLQFFTIKSMRIASKKAGLKLEKVKTITHSDWLYYQQIHLLFYPQIGEPSLFWSPKAQKERSKKQKIQLKAMGALRRLKIYHLITRFFDLIRMGDNYLFFIRKPE